MKKKSRNLLLLCLVPLLFISCATKEITIPNTNDSAQKEITIPNTGGVTIQFAKVNAGTFNMGSPESESARASDETQHEVIIPKPYMIGTYEVTQQQWEAVMGSNPSAFKGAGLPVEQVSWNDAVKFCNALSNFVGRDPAYTINGTNVSCDFTKNGFRLPTEAEWEYAARGGGLDNYKVYSGSNNFSEVGWNGDSSGSTHVVGQKAPNALGIYDMSGNVWEWCWDWYGNYPVSNGIDPTGPRAGSSRVIRGGGWYYGSRGCRSALRRSFSPAGSDYTLGFRLAVSLP
jgi:formylglycine-generating enzyme